jgi:hypothetical protein
MEQHPFRNKEGRHELKPEALVHPKFFQCSNKMVIKYKHEPKFRFYILAFSYLTIDEIFTKICRVS